MDLTRYEAVVGRVADAARRAGRDQADVTLVAVSKERSVAEIGALYELGHRDFGENRASEMSEKAGRLPDDIRWHFVGSLQSNKVRVVRGSTHLLHSLDRDSLAKAWVKGPGAPPRSMIQVNIGREPQKGGVDPGEAEVFAGRVLELGIEVVGLMAIPPLGSSPEDSRPHFVALRDLRDRVERAVPGARALSMGMTDDFEVAVEEGASIIRVGRAIFGSTV